jgi:hypothetical protein
MKKLLFVLTLSVVLPVATLAHASNIVGGSNSDIVGGSNSSIVGGSNSSVSWVSILLQSLVTIVGGSN